MPVTNRGERGRSFGAAAQFPLPEDFDSIGYRLFTEKLATKWGYHIAPSADEESAKLWVEVRATVDSYCPDAELDAALLSCTDEVRDWDEDTFSTYDGVNYLSGWSGMPPDTAAHSSTVVVAA